MVEAIKNIGSSLEISYRNMDSEERTITTRSLTEIALDNTINNKEIDKDEQVKKTSASDQNIGIKDFETQLNEFLKDENLTLEFKKDDDTQKMIMKLIDNETEEVVKQFPAEISLQIARMVSSILERNGITNAKV